jgi:hypothetical protein
MDISKAIVIMSNAVAFLLIAAVFLGVAYKVWFHISPLLAFPIYAAFIFIELVVSGFGQKPSPVWACFNYPKSPHAQMLMDFVAFLSLVSVYLLSTKIKMFSESEMPIKLLQGELWEQNFVWYFCITNFLVYLISLMSDRDTTHPIKKMKSLGMPKIAREYFGIDT